MLTRYSSRRLAALLALAGMTNAAGFLAAQPPARATIGAQGGKKAPSLLSSCDVTLQSCGGDPILGGGSSGGGYSPTGDAPACGTGSRVQCRKDSTWKCLAWVPLTVNGSLGPSGGGGTTQMVCSSSVTVVTILYWP